MDQLAESVQKPGRSCQENERERNRTESFCFRKSLKQKVCFQDIWDILSRLFECWWHEKTKRPGLLCQDIPWLKLATNYQRMRLKSFGNFQPEHAETSCLTFDIKTPPEPGSVPSVRHRWPDKTWAAKHESPCFAASRFEGPAMDLSSCGLPEDAWPKTYPVYAYIIDEYRYEWLMITLI